MGATVNTAVSLYLWPALLYSYTTACFAHTAGYKERVWFSGYTGKVIGQSNRVTFQK